jgi:hypothetical protein
VSLTNRHGHITGIVKVTTPDEDKRIKEIMSKTDITTTAAKLLNVPQFEINPQDKAVALSLGVALGESVDTLMQQVIDCENAATRLHIETGYILLQVKALTAHGQFTTVLEPFGVDRSKATECMAMAKSFSLLDDEQRKKALQLGKSKAVALFKADAAVVAQYLTDEGIEEANILSVRDFRERLQVTEAQLTNAQVENSTLQSQLKTMTALADTLKRPVAAGVKPYVVQDMNEEVAVYSKKSELAMAGLRKQMLDAAALQDTLPDWATMVQKNAYAAAVKVLLEAGELVQMAKQAGLDQHDYAKISVLETLTDGQLAKVADYHERLNRLDEVEAHNRVVARKNARPQGKGAPMKPIAVNADDAVLAG